MLLVPSYMPPKCQGICRKSGLNLAALWSPRGTSVSPSPIRPLRMEAVLAHLFVFWGKGRNVTKQQKTASQLLKRRKEK